MNSRIVIIDSGLLIPPSPAYHPSFPANLNQPENHSRQCQSNDRIESWCMMTRARTMDARYWMTPPPSVLLPTVPSHAVGLIVPSAHCCCAACSNIDQTSIVTTKQRQAAVELFRGIDVDKNAMLSQEVSPLAKRLTISLR